MTTTTYTSTTNTGTRQEGALRRWAAVLLIVEALLIFVPLIVLGAAINWPASLDEPASVNLPLILEQFPAVLAGYSVYLGYSLLFWPVAYLAGRVIVQGDVENPLLRIANGFAAISAVARALGIVRWLFAMPVLAELYVSGSPAMQETISVVYEMLNAYAGGVGELLGVGLFAALWVALISTLILRSEVWPRWLAYWGYIAALGLASTLVAVLGVDAGPLATVTVAILHFWMLAAAAVFLVPGLRRGEVSGE